MLLSRSQRQHGFEVVTDAMLGQEVHDNFTCAHCGVNRRIKPMKVVGNVMSDEPNASVYDRCTCCDKLVCLSCMDKPCVPLIKRIEAMENGRRLDAALKG